MSAVKSWVEYWDGDHPIYVNARHKAVHADAVGAAIVALIPNAHARVLDYGCGEALYADQVAARSGRLYLCEAAPNLRARLAERMRTQRNVTVIDGDGAAALPDGSIDLIVMNSVAQYLSRADLEAFLQVSRRKLAPQGALVIADVIPPDVNPVTDATALLSFAAKGGFLLAAVGGLARTVLSNYAAVRKSLGFATYTQAEFETLLAGAGFRPERVRPNFGHNQSRMAFRATLS